MILTKTSEYAIRILTFMAVNSHERHSAKLLHEQLNIPYKYLTLLMTALAKHGYVTSIQGRNGGFIISKNFSEISVVNIVEAIEGKNRFNKCILGFDECSDENPCALHSFWKENKKNIINMLENTTLEQLTKTNFFNF